MGGWGRLLLLTVGAVAGAVPVPDCSRVPYGWEAYWQREGLYNHEEGHEWLDPTVRKIRRGEKPGYPLMSPAEREPTWMYEFELPEGSDPHSGTQVTAYRSKYFSELTAREQSRFLRGDRISFFYRRAPWVPSFVQDRYPVRKIWCARKFLSHETYFVWDGEDLFAPPFAIKLPRSYGTEGVSMPPTIPAAVAGNDYVEDAMRVGAAPSFYFYPERLGTTLHTLTGSYGNIYRKLEPVFFPEAARYERVSLASAVGKLDYLGRAARRAGLTRAQWIERHLLRRLAEMVVDALYFRGALFEEHDQNLDLWIHRENGSLAPLAVKDASDILLAPLSRLLLEGRFDPAAFQPRRSNLLHGDLVYQLASGVDTHSVSYLLGALLSLSTGRPDATEIIYRYLRIFREVSAARLRTEFPLAKSAYRFLALAPAEIFSARDFCGGDTEFIARTDRQFRRLWGFPHGEELENRLLGAAVEALRQVTFGQYFEYSWRSAQSLIRYGSEVADSGALRSVFLRQRSSNRVVYMTPAYSHSLLPPGGWESDEIRFARLDHVVVAFLGGGREPVPLGIAHHWDEKSEAELLRAGAPPWPKSCPEAIRERFRGSH